MSAFVTAQPLMEKYESPVISIIFEADNSRAGVSCQRISLRANCIPPSYVLVTNTVTTIKGTFAAFSLPVLSTVLHSLGPASPD